MIEVEGIPLPHTRAPDFCLPASASRRVRLASLRGRPVVLIFYPADWSPVCGEQLATCQAMLPRFERFGAVMLGVSVDDVWSHRAFAASRGIGFDLLSDGEPRGEVARRYGVYQPDDGVCGRALFVLDADGVVAYTHLSSQSANPGADGILAAVGELQVVAARERDAPARRIGVYPSLSG